MDHDQASATALATSLMRAAHTRLGQPPLIADPWGDILLSDDEREGLRQMALSEIDPAARAGLEDGEAADQAWQSFFLVHPTSASVIVRCRFAEDALAAAVARGVRQYVIVGAGLDSFALRRPAFAADLQILEIDLPGTQEMKLGRLREREVELPERTAFVSADLSNEPLDQVLARSPYDPEVPAFFAWLGVASYLTREANLTTLGAIAASSAPGSELVFSYLDQREFDPETVSGELERSRAAVKAAGEPWVSGFHPAELAGDLAAVGLELLEDLDGEAQWQRYCADREDGLRPAASIHVARARPAA